MSCLLSTVSLVALLAAGTPAPPGWRACHPARPDSTAEGLILGEVRAFYRDLDHRSWAPLLDHFLPAKVTARWVPPTADPAWTGLAAPAPDRPERAEGAASPCAPRAAVAIVGAWARARVRRCTAPVDELWLLRVSGRWKIVHLALATPSSARGPHRARRAVGG